MGAGVVECGRERHLCDHGRVSVPIYAGCCVCRLVECLPGLTAVVDLNSRGQFCCRDVIRDGLRPDLYSRRCGHVDGVGYVAGRRGDEHERVEREVLSADHGLRERGGRREEPSGRASSLYRDGPE